jgi:hypothetical protein
MTVLNTKQTPKKNTKTDLDQSASPAPYQRATNVDADTMTTDATDLADFLAKLPMAH